MEQLVEQLYESTNDENWYSPQTLAWKLITDDFGENDNLSNMIMSYNADSTIEHDPCSFLFEILLTIFMEMIFDFAMIMSAKECDNNGEEFNFKPDMKFFNMDDYIELIQDKFFKVSIMLTVNKYDTLSNDQLEQDYMQHLIDKRYCKIILKQNEIESHLFDLYRVSPDVNYHMILNSKTTKTNILNNIYAICKINNILYQISFYVGTV